MNIGLILLMLIGGSVGVFSTLYILISLPVIIFLKIYRKIRFGASLYDQIKSMIFLSYACFLQS